METDTKVYDESDYDFVAQAIVFGSFAFLTRNDALLINTFDVSVGNKTKQYNITDELWRSLGFRGLFGTAN